MNRSFFPNFLTSLNLLSGCVAVVLTSQGLLKEGALFVLLSALFDFADGFVARLVKGATPFGTQLDSLADMVTFGFYPGFLLFQLISVSLGVYFVPIIDRSGLSFLLPFAGFIVTIFAALRLAKFNLSTDQSSSFSGMPVPAMTMSLLFIPGFLETDLELNILNRFDGSAREYVSQLGYSGMALLFQETWFLLLLSALLSALMVSNFRFIALKFKGNGFRRFVPALLLVIPSSVFIIYFYIEGYLYLQYIFMMLWYIIVSIFSGLFFPKLYEIHS